MFPTIRKRLNKFIGISVMYIGISIDQLTPEIITHIVEFEYIVPVMPMDPPNSLIHYLAPIQKRTIPQKINP